MQSKPEKKLNLLDTSDMKYIFTVGVIATALVLGSFWWFGRTDAGLGKAAAFSVLTLIQSFIFINVWLSKRSLIQHANKLLSPIFFIAFSIPFVTQIAIVQFTPLAKLFRIPTVSLTEFGAYIFISASILLFIHLARPLLRTPQVRK